MLWLDWANRWRCEIRIRSLKKSDCGPIFKVRLSSRTERQRLKREDFNKRKAAARAPERIASPKWRYSLELTLMKGQCLFPEFDPNSLKCPLSFSRLLLVAPKIESQLSDYEEERDRRHFKTGPQSISLNTQGAYCFLRRVQSKQVSLFSKVARETHFGNNKWP